mmetsp:Transcript_83160/g.233002  ORF Transcript_83160/g.233002 Transcript_83160/m.233002 type:complete len:200 (-) Transcript_83160:590-1189(-)
MEIAICTSVHAAQANLSFAVERLVALGVVVPDFARGPEPTRGARDVEAAAEVLLQGAHVGAPSGASPGGLGEAALPATQEYRVRTRRADEAREEHGAQLVGGDVSFVPAEVVHESLGARSPRIAPDVQIAGHARHGALQDDLAVADAIHVQAQHAASADGGDVRPPPHRQQALRVKRAVAALGARGDPQVQAALVWGEE